MSFLTYFQLPGEIMGDEEKSSLSRNGRQRNDNFVEYISQ